MGKTTALPRPFADELTRPAHEGLRRVLEPAAWNRLPEAVRDRFDGSDATYAGVFEIVRANVLGRVFAWLGMLVGKPVAPRIGTNVEARVHVRARGDGTTWLREYLWADGRRDLVRSTKVVDAGRLVERLPARLCMPLDTYEQSGVVHFVSRGYFFDLGLGLKLWLPAFFTPGVTHVQHIDLGHGWFRFTMTVVHPQFGEMFFQTGRFCAMEDP